jgi:hypothetical protein
VASWYCSVYVRFSTLRALLVSCSLDVRTGAGEPAALLREAVDEVTRLQVTYIAACDARYHTTVNSLLLTSSKHRYGCYVCITLIMNKTKGSK